MRGAARVTPDVRLSNAGAESRAAFISMKFCDLAPPPIVVSRKKFVIALDYVSATLANPILTLYYSSDSLVANP